jgi:hypothetical protein
MGTTQGRSLCSYLYFKLAKHYLSHFIFYIFSSTKSEIGRAKQVLFRNGGVGTSGRGLVSEKGIGG